MTQPNHPDHPPVEGGYRGSVKDPATEAYKELNEAACDLLSTCGPQMYGPGKSDIAVVRTEKLIRLDMATAFIINKYKVL